MSSSRAFVLRQTVLIQARGTHVIMSIAFNKRCQPTLGSAFRRTARILSFKASHAMFLSGGSSILSFIRGRFKLRQMPSSPSSDFFRRVRPPRCNRQHHWLCACHSARPNRPANKDGYGFVTDQPLTADAGTPSPPDESANIQIIRQANYPERPSFARRRPICLAVGAPPP